MPRLLFTVIVSLASYLFYFIFILVLHRFSTNWTDAITRCPFASMVCVCLSVCVFALLCLSIWTMDQWWPMPMWLSILYIHVSRSKFFASNMKWWIMMEMIVIDNTVAGVSSRWVPVNDACVPCCMYALVCVSVIYIISAFKLFVKSCDEMKRLYIISYLFRWTIYCFSCSLLGQPFADYIS